MAAGEEVAKKRKLGLGEVESVLKNGEEERGGLEEEEETQLQSSLPWYLEHVFGTAIGSSQSQQTLSQAQKLSQSRGHGHSHSQAVLLAESQGFVIEATDTSGRLIKKGAPGPHVISATIEDAPGHLVNSATIEHAFSGGSHKPACLNMPSAVPGSQSSAVLFPLPQHSASACNMPREGASHSTVDLPSATTTKHEVETSEAARKRKDVVSVSSRKRKRSRVADEVNYSCPPSCTPLARCAVREGTVNLLAVVMQGLKLQCSL